MKGEDIVAATAWREIFALVPKDKSSPGVTNVDLINIAALIKQLKRADDA